ncbi:hypothetical protein GQ43DRAFT_470834 [Delitschia confertaspora ATCC 74209]|uniref:USP domain-containing protein n=1 Tax=Delitschia confertaspora ATCC 74209 TaxID=1513339 RepID=A0A9P4MTX9_9PLEO|nr:hypothetical protein GQ43DRAFT_470834 [Delitschia confertaspora ATCC 74209]
MNCEVALKEKLGFAFSNPDGLENPSYRLISIVNHLSANVHSGHYVAYTRHADEDWWLCNDVKVSAKTFEEVVSSYVFQKSTHLSQHEIELHVILNPAIDTVLNVFFWGFSQKSAYVQEDQ